MIIALCIIILIAVVLSTVLAQASLRKSDDEYKEVHKLITERFQSNEFQAHPKNEVYNRYFRYFYSSGSGNVDTTIMFMPSVTDVACMNFADDINDDIICGREEGSAPIDRMSVKDASASMGIHPYEVCGSRSASLGPLDPQDALVRVLNSMYRFKKCCVQLPYLEMQQGGSVTEVNLKLPADDHATLFAMLVRPIFITTNSSFVYHVTVDDQYAFGYGDPGEYQVTLKLRKLEDMMLYEPGTYSNRKNLTDVYDPQPEEKGFMNATLYYLSYESPVRRGISDVKFSEHMVITLVFPVYKKRSGGGSWYSTSNMSVVYDGDETHDVIVNVHGQTQRIRVGNHGYLIVNHATDRLFLCYMSRGKVRMSQHQTASPLVLDDHEYQDMKQQAENAGAKPPATCFPCTFSGIPNLYDMYSKLVAFS